MENGGSWESFLDRIQSSRETQIPKNIKLWPNIFNSSPPPLAALELREHIRSILRDAILQPLLVSPNLFDAVRLCQSNSYYIALPHYNNCDVRHACIQSHNYVHIEAE